MSYRPLALVSGVTVCDFLLWNWSLSANQDVLALVSGLTLPPLAAACLLLLAVTLARLFARYTQRPPIPAGSRSPRAERRRRPRRRPEPGSSLQEGAEPSPAAGAASRASTRDSRKLAA